MIEACCDGGVYVGWAVAAGEEGDIFKVCDAKFDQVVDGFEGG